MLNRVIQWSLDHRTVVLLAWAGVAVMGVVAFLRLPLDAFPDTSPVQVRVMQSSQPPIRVICPSAKMQTTWPSRIASLAVCNDLIMSRGRSCEEIGMARASFMNGFTYQRS